MLEGRAITDPEVEEEVHAGMCAEYSSLDLMRV